MSALQLVETKRNLSQNHNLKKTLFPLQPIDPPKKHGSRWSQEEVDLLLNAIDYGHCLKTIQKLFPLRTWKAILNKALSLGYASHTKMGTTLFIYGIQRRRRRTLKEIKNGAAATAPLEYQIKKLTKNIITYSTFQQNILINKIDQAEALLHDLSALLNDIRRAS